MTTGSRLSRRTLITASLALPAVATAAAVLAQRRRAGLPSARWHVPHAWIRKTFSPATATGTFCAPGVSPESHASNAAGSIATTRPIMPECSVPQYSAQNRWYVPGFVASNHAVE